uniref:Protein kinase domain-containing protein n=1 Tax=Anisakis simplex TaxID=6269 RepID=A0A0M3K6K0_ANISI
LIDFGMARHYIGRNGVVKPRRKSSPFHVEALWYVTEDLMQDMSRFDDLWSVYYICVENMVGQLPWRFETEKKEVQNMKETINLLEQEYGEEPGPPASLVTLHRHLRQASFYNEPKYEQINADIELDMIQRNFSLGDRLDWQSSRRSKAMERRYRFLNYAHNCRKLHQKVIKQNDERSSYYYVEEADEAIQ